MTDFAALAAAVGANEKPAPQGYFSSVSARSEIVESILRYVAASDAFIGAPAAQNLSREAGALMLQVALAQAATGTPSCTTPLPSGALESQFARRAELHADHTDAKGGTRH